VAALACAAHYIFWNGLLATRMAMVDNPRPIDVAVGIVFAALLLEASRRHTGGALVVLTLVFVVYAFAGPWLPGFLSHGGVTGLKFVDLQMLTTEGVFGIPVLVSTSFIFLFVLFGAVMLHGGLLGFFTDLALAVAGTTRGGAGKVAVISSGLFGTVNGSAIANAVTTGSFTIPLMMRAGYRPEFAAGVEATASMGGQLIPPVMGAAAFIMAETLGMSYWSIAVAAAIPGVLYFVAVGVMVHYEATRLALPVLDRAEVPRLSAVLRRDFFLLAGPAVLLWFLANGYTAERAGFWALVVAVVTSWIRPGSRIGAAKMLTVMVEGAYGAMPVALACAVVGIVVGVVSITGLGLKLATGIVGLAQGSLLVTSILTMIAALILGTGLPTSATYIITSIMAAPALVQLGVPLLAAHMFVFYFGILADLTPPTAISTYATSAIAGADVWRTQWVAMMAGAVRLHHPVQLRLRPGAAADEREHRAHRDPHGGGDAGDRDARHRRDRVSPRAHPAVGAAGAAGRRSAADLSRDAQQRRRRGVLRGGVGGAGEPRGAPTKGRNPEGRCRAALSFCYVWIYIANDRREKRSDRPSLQDLRAGRSTCSGRGPGSAPTTRNPPHPGGARSHWPPGTIDACPAGIRLRRRSRLISSPPSTRSARACRPRARRSAAAGCTPSPLRNWATLRRTG
jgi:TRAP transporter 4TM/12TM fusion protein